MIDDPTSAVTNDEQDADECRLIERSSIWRPTADGRDIHRSALDAVVAALWMLITFQTSTPR
jgi:hypothetical protein